MVTLLDIRSGTPQLAIDVGVSAEGLGLRGGAVVVVDWGKTTTWKLLGGCFFLAPQWNVPGGCTGSGVRSGVQEECAYGSQFLCTQN